MFQICTPAPRPHLPPAPIRDEVRPLASYWVHLEVTPIIFDVDLGYATSRLLIHLHRLDTILHQEETPKQALLGEGNWASGIAGCWPQSEAHHILATEATLSSGCPFSVKGETITKVTHSLGPDLHEDWW